MNRSTPLKRSGFKAKPRHEPTGEREPKPQAKDATCSQCDKPFARRRAMQDVCSPKCAERKALGKLTKREAEKLKEMKDTIPKLIARAQDAFNGFIRERDRHKGCFVCGRSFDSAIPGRALHAGHVRSRGAAGHLRFHEDNCLGECEGCNDPKWGAKPHEIEAGAIRRIGEARYLALKYDNTPRKWERDELKSIATTYRAKTRELLRKESE